MIKEEHLLMEGHGADCETRAHRERNADLVQRARTRAQITPKIAKRQKMPPSCTQEKFNERASSDLEMRNIGGMRAFS